jgi:predicted NBD/HSP70 family sugar kinase
MKKIHLQRAKNQIARPNTIRDINKQIVLNFVRDRAPISRAEIARETALQRSTVSAIVDDLQLDGLIEELGTGDSTGGRKPTLLKLKTGVPLAIGVDVTPLKTTIALADLAGQILQKETFPTSPNVEFMTRQIIEKVKKYALENKNLNLEVGISVPGIADQTTGNVLYIPYFQWSDWDICQQITEQTGLSATVDNDANAIALAELWFGEERDRKARNFITVLVSEGIGTGIIFDGQIYRGQKGAAGEFGHMFVGENSGVVVCSCGNTHCWEAFASNTATLARYKNTNGTRETNIDEIFARALEGDKLALRVVDKTTKYLAVGIVNLIVGLSPEAVIVSGKITSVWSRIEKKLLAAISENIKQELPETKVRASTLGDAPTLMGAISLSLIKKFASAR